LEVQRAARSDLGCRILLVSPCRPPSSPDSVGGRLQSGSDAPAGPGAGGAGAGAGAETASAAASATTAGACSSLRTPAPSLRLRPPPVASGAPPGLVGGRIVLLL